MTERSWVPCPLCGESAQRSEAGLVCTNMECLSNGGQSGTAIDWKQRFKDQVADNIEAKTKHRAKLSEVLLALEEANRKIVDLERIIDRLTPASVKLARAEQSLVEAANRVRELKDEIRAKETIIARGQRATIEGVIDWLRNAVDKLPEAEEEEEANLTKFGRRPATVLDRDLAGIFITRDPENQ